MKRVQDHVLDDLKEHVDKLPPRRNLRPYDVVAEMLEHYTSSRERGYDLDDFVSTLDKHGIKLTRTTVRNYLSRARAEQRKRTGHAKPPRTKAAPVAATDSDAKFDTQSARISGSAQVPAPQPQPTTTAHQPASTTTEDGKKKSEPDLRPGQWVMKPDRERL